MWIRILGTLYNLSLVQTIKYDTHNKELKLYYGAYSNGRSETATINFTHQDGNKHGLAVYAQLMQKLTVIKSIDHELKPITEADLNQDEGINPNAEFITGTTVDTNSVI